jgi:hypothetical protein
MNDLVRHKLREIVAEYGQSTCDDPRRCEALLKDLCGENKKEIAALIGALKEGVPGNMLKAREGVPTDVVLAQVTERLLQALPLTEDAARWAVGSWALALGSVSAQELSEWEGRAKPPPPSPRPPSPNFRMVLNDHKWHDIEFANLTNWVKNRRATLDSGNELVGKTFRYRFDTRRRKYQLRLRNHLDSAVYQLRD